MSPPPLHIRRLVPSRPIPLLAVLVSVAALLVSTAAGAQAGLKPVAVIGGGGGHVLAVKKNGTVWAWGHNAHGQLGIGRVGSPVLKPAQVRGITGLTQVIGGEFHSVVLQKDGTVWAWGDNESGQLGTGSSGSDEPSPVQVRGIKGAIAVDADGDHSYALLSDGTVRAWGENDEGQLGNGTTKESNSPVRVSISGVAALASGKGHTLALTGAKSKLGKGVVLAWGDNRLGQLGLGSATDSNRTTPVRVKGLPGKVIGIAAGVGGDYSLALLANGTVWSWGLNAQGQLGNGSFDTKGCKCRPTPAKVNGVKGAIAVAASGGAGYALLKNGTVWAWGNNEFGQLGRGKIGGKSAQPQQMQGLTGVKALAAGGGYVVALKSDSSLVALGMNTFGQLGVGTTKASAEPVTVGVTSSEESSSFKLGPFSAVTLVLVIVGALLAIAVLVFVGLRLRRRAATRPAAAPKAVWGPGANPHASFGAWGEGPDPSFGPGGAPDVPIVTPGTTVPPGGDPNSRRIQLLSGSGHFAEVSHDVLAQVATLLKPLTVPAGGIVCREGEPGDHFFLIETGTLAVTADVGGQPRELALLGPGQAFGETALGGQESRRATVRATTDAQLWALSAEDFQELRTRHPEIATVTQRAAAQRDATRPGVFNVEQREIAAGQPSGRVRIGRASDNDMVFSSSLVSSHHAEIEFDGDAARLRDLDSTNGTFVNGNRIQAVDLNDGDDIRVGDERFTFDPRAVRASLAPPAPAPAHAPAQIRIGRAADNDIVFESRLISAHHALIESVDGGYRLRDLNSTNGTFVNGARIRSATLTDGDEIWVGDERFIFDRRAIHSTPEPNGIRIDATELTREVRGGKRLLNDISLSILPGEFVAIVGGSGAGKTTLMDAMSGVHPATTGRLLYNGREYYQNLAFFRNVLGYVPQDDIIHTGLPARVTLRHAARLRLPPDTSPAEFDQAVDKALAELELTQQADLKVSMLSGGQRKRASIGVELLTEPRIFFLDEPTSGLDPFTDAQMMGLLRGLADGGSTVILTTHATMNVMLCDKVVFLARGGYLAFVGPPQRALEYFEADSFNTIYQRLAEEATPEEWSQRFRDSADYQRVVADQLRPPEADLEGGAPQSLAESAPSFGLARAVRQFTVLSRRSFDLFRYNPSNLPSLVLPPVIFSLLALALFGSNVFGSNENSAAALQIVFLITFSAFIFGLLFAVQEIVKEFPIFRRERLVNLGVVPYVLSKTTVLAPLLVVLLIVMVGILRVTGRLPDAGFDLYGKMMLTLVLTAFAGLALALFTSALVVTSQQATDMLSVWIMPQVLFGGALVAVPLMNVVGQAFSAVAPVRWSFEAVGQIVDLPEQFNSDTSRIGPGLAIQYEGSFTRDPAQNWLILLLFIVIPLALTCVVLKRKTTPR